MRTEHEIYMDFNRAYKQAQRLRQIASRVNSLANDDVGGTLNQINQNWNGDNASAFLGKGETLKGKISKTAGDLNRVAQAIIDIATRTRDAELAAIQVASD